MPSEQVILDGEPQTKNWATIISDWTEASVAARDAEIDSLLGVLRTATNYSGMQSLVRQSHCYWTPRHWENPPFNLTTKDEEHMVYPWLFGVMENILAVSTPSNLRVRVLPLGDDTAQFSAFSNSLLVEEFEELKIDRVVRAAAFRAKHYGAQFVFQGMSSYGGNLNLKRTLEFCDPLSILWEPGVENLEDSKYIIWKKWSPISHVKRQYGLTEKIEPKELEAKYRTDLTVQGMGGGSAIQDSLKLRCVETLLFLKDSSQDKSRPLDVLKRIAAKLGMPVEAVPQTPEVAGLVNQLLLTDKFPFGRMVALVNGEKVFDDKNPFDHTQNPFHLLKNHGVPGCLWGMPEWLANGDTQTVINEGATGMVRGARMAQGKLTYVEEALKDATQKANLENTNPTIPVKFKEEFIGKEWTNIVQYGNPNFQHGEVMKSALMMGDRNSGVNDASRGMPNSDITSGKQAQVMTANATGRQQLFAQSLDEFVEGIGYQALFNGLQFRQDSDVIAIASNAVLHDEQGQPITQFRLEEFKAIFSQIIKFKVKLQAQSGLPTDRLERFEKLKETIPLLSQLARTDPFAAETLVDMSDIPELREYLDKVKTQISLAPPMASAPPAANPPE